MSFTTKDDLWDDDDPDDAKHQFKEERSEIMHPTLYIENIPDSIHNQGLYGLFSRFGNVLRADTRPSIKIANSQIGFVVYDSLEAAQKAIQAMNRAPPLNLIVKMKLKKEGPPVIQDRYSSCVQVAPQERASIYQKQGMPLLPNPVTVPLLRNPLQLHPRPVGCFPQQPVYGVPPTFIPRQVSRMMQYDDKLIPTACDRSVDRNKFVNSNSNHSAATPRSSCGTQAMQNRRDQEISEWIHDTQYANYHQGMKKKIDYDPPRRKLEQDEQEYRREPRDALISSNESRKYYCGDRAINKRKMNACGDGFSDEDNSDDKEQADVEDNLDEIEREDDPIIAITVSEKGRTVSLGPLPISKVSTAATRMKLSQRPEFRSEPKSDCGDINDYDRTKRRHFSEEKHHGGSQEMLKYQNSNSHTSRRSDSGLSEDMKTLRLHSRNSNFAKLSDGTDINRQNWQPRTSQIGKHSTSHKSDRSNSSNLDSSNSSDRSDSKPTRIPTPKPTRKQALKPNVNSNLKGKKNSKDTDRNGNLKEKKISKDKSSCSVTPASRPPLEKPFKCVVSHAESPDILWIQLDEFKLNCLTQQLKEQRKPDDVDKLRIGIVYLIEHNSIWFRGEIMKINQNGKYDVLLVDYGKTIKDVAVNSITLLSHSNFIHPLLAIKCKLSPQMIRKYKSSTEIFEISPRVELVVEMVNDEFKIVNIVFPKCSMNISNNFKIDKPKPKEVQFRQNRSLHEEKHSQITDACSKSIVTTKASGKINLNCKFTVNDLPKLPFNMKEVTNVMMVYVNSAESICICPSESAEELNRLISVLTNYIDAGIPYKPIQKELVLAKFTDDLWYRAEVEEINASGDEVRVFYIDFGNTETIDTSHIRPILPEALQFPQFGVMVSLNERPRSLGPLEAFTNKSIDMRVVNDKVRPMVVQFSCGGKHIFPTCQNVGDGISSDENSKLATYTLKNLKRPHIDLGPIEAYFGSAGGDEIYIIPKLNDDLLKVLRNYHASDSESDYAPQNGELCLVYLIEEREWHRAACISKEFSGKYIVCCFDYGFMSEVDGKFLRRYDEKFAEVPAMAVKCKLDGYPNNEDICKKIDSLVMLLDDITCDVLVIRKDYIEIRLLDD